MATIKIRISKMNVKIESGKIYNHSEDIKMWDIPIDENLYLNNFLDEIEEYIQERPKNDWQQPFEPLCQVYLYNESDWMITNFGSRDSVTENAILEVFKKMCENLPQKCDYGLDFDDYLFREVFRDWI